MSVWRHKAHVLFPELGRELDESDYSVYQLYFDLLPMVRDAHRRRDRLVLSRIYGFAEWCLSQREKDLWNSAAVCFYEHLFDDTTLWDETIPWVSPFVIEMVKGLWESRLSVDMNNQLCHRLAAARKPHEGNIYSTGEINGI